jgi:hypothetical protein
LAPGNKHEAKKSKAHQALLDVDSDTKKPEEEAKWIELRRATRAFMVSVERDAEGHG